jgi:tRNA(fMet)-specific endonuclease VapC
MLGAIPTLAFGDLPAEACGSIVARAGYSRRKLLGRMITAQGLVPRATLVTLNATDFADIRDSSPRVAIGTGAQSASC